MAWYGDADYKISIHAPREGSDNVKADWNANALEFQSTLPVKGATMMFVSIRSLAIFQSTLPVKGATIIVGVFTGDLEFQSTLPVKGATKRIQLVDDGTGISIHAPREGSDRIGSLKRYTNIRFQSTLPVKGATSQGTAMS